VLLAAGTCRFWRANATLRGLTPAVALAAAATYD